MHTLVLFPADENKEADCILEETVKLYYCRKGGMTRDLSRCPTSLHGGEEVLGAHDENRNVVHTVIQKILDGICRDHRAKLEVYMSNSSL